MATLSTSLPATRQAFYTPSQTAANKAALLQIAKTYQKEIAQASVACNVPSALIVTIIFVESRGVPTAVTSVGAVGLMQMIPSSAMATIHLEARQGRMSPTEQALLIKHIGQKRYDCYANAANLHVVETKCPKLTVAELKDPALNILLGTMTISRNIDETKENGKVRVDKMYFRYWGPFYKFKSPAGSSVDTIIAEARKKSREVHSGILKMIGKNGLLQQMVQAAA